MSAQTVQPRGRSANIFINYRREDSSGHAGRLFDALSSRFPGRLFMDIDTLQPGVDFVDAIEQAVASCDVLLVVIGREWLTVQNAAGKRRLDDPADFVRLELESALTRSIRVIPVLVQDAPMPPADVLPPSIARLARRNAIELSDARWAYDVHRLGDTLQQVLGEADAPAPPPEPPVVDGGAARRRAWLLPTLGGLGVVAAVVLASWLWSISHSAKPIPAPPPAAQGTAAAVDLHLGGDGGHAGPAIPPAQPTSQGSGSNPQPTTPSSASSPPPAAPAGSADVAKPAAPHGTGADRARDEAARRQATRASQTTTPPDEAARRRAARASARSKAQVPQVKPPHADEVIEISDVSASDRRPGHDTSSEIVPPPAPRVTITAPAAGEKVGSSVQVQGTAAGLGEQRIFLCIKQPDGRYYPRGEIFPKDGQWTIQLRSSKEKSFDVLVVASHSKEASQALSDQTSRDNGLAPLPAGATIAGSAVSVQRKRTLFGIE